MPGFIDHIAGNPLVIADGAMGTLLAARGLRAGETPERMNIDNPAAVEAVHRDYLEAGAAVLVTNTFGANPFKLARTGLDARLAEVNGKAAEAARRACRAAGGPAFVAGSIGPSGELPVPLGRVSVSELAAGFEAQARALADAGVDLFIIETMSSIVEANAALEAVRSASGLPAVLSFTFTPGRKGPRTLMGESPEDIAAAFREKAACLGTNCGEGPDAAAGVIARMTNNGARPPLWAKPNAGRPELRAGETVYPLDPEGFAAHIGELAGAGAGIIGGCCGTTPGHIAALRKAAERRR